MAVILDGVESARPSGAVLEAIAGAEVIVIGPSNPFVSIGPILGLAGVKEVIAASSAPAIAVSPIVAGRALKGPADRMMASLGHEQTALGVARIYAGLVDLFILDESDAGLAADVETLGMTPGVMQTVMRDEADRRALAASIVASAAERPRHLRDR